MKKMSFWFRTSVALFSIAIMASQPNAASAEGFSDMYKVGELIHYGGKVYRFVASADGENILECLGPAGAAAAGTTLAEGCICIVGAAGVGAALGGGLVACLAVADRDGSYSAWVRKTREIDPHAFDHLP